MIEPWVIELNNHISLFWKDDDVDEYVPYMVAKQMIAEREARIARAAELDQARREFALAYPEYAHTWDWSEHPAGWDNPCMCEDCRSYGD